MHDGTCPTSPPPRLNGASAEEVSWYRHALATVYGQIFEQILEPVVKLHPELKPAAWQRDEAAREFARREIPSA